MQKININEMLVYLLDFWYIKYNYNKFNRNRDNIKYITIFKYFKNQIS